MLSDLHVYLCIAQLHFNFRSSTTRPSRSLSSFTALRLHIAMVSLMKQIIAMVSLMKKIVPLKIEPSKEKKMIL